MKCPKCGEEILAPWEPTSLDRYKGWLRIHSPTYGQGTGET